MSYRDPGSERKFEEDGRSMSTGARNRNICLGDSADLPGNSTPNENVSLQKAAKRASKGTIYSKPGNAQLCSIIPCLPERSTLSMFSHIGRIIKLVFSQSLLSESQLKEALSYTILGSSISVFVSLVGYSEFIYEYMRSNWAFQGEFRYKMEEYTKAAHLVCILDLVFRILLRLNLYSDTFSIDTSENLYARWTVRSLVTLRLALLSYIHYVLFSHNWNTASFLISPQTSKLVSKLVVNFLVFSIIFNLVDSLKMRSIDNLLNITNLVSPSEFKAEILNSQVYRELCAITYNMPRIIRKNGLHKVDYLVTVAHIIDEIKSYLPHTIDWISLFLNLTLALYSNSAGGLYLSALQTFSNVVDDQMCNIERKAVS